MTTPSNFIYSQCFHLRSYVSDNKGQQAALNMENMSISLYALCCGSPPVLINLLPMQHPHCSSQPEPCNLLSFLKEHCSVWSRIGCFRDGSVNIRSTEERRNTEGQYGWFCFRPTVRCRANLLHQNTTVNRNKVDPSSTTCHQHNQTFADTSITVIGFSSYHWWVKNNDDQRVPENCLHSAFLMYQLRSLLKIFYFFYEQIFFIWTPEHWTKCLMRCICFTSWDGTQSSVHRGNQRHTQTDAGDGEGHRSKRFVIQLRLFTRNIL